jgi:hypothetical protein
MAHPWFVLDRAEHTPCFETFKAGVARLSNAERVAPCRRTDDRDRFDEVRSAGMFELRRAAYAGSDSTEAIIARAIVVSHHRTTLARLQERQAG